MSTFLLHAEALEKEAATERVAYFEKTGVAGRILDVGCGNGYSVAEWNRRGHHAVGVDAAIYRLSRWLVEHRDRRAFVVADARALPFRPGGFDHVVSSGVIEHIGVEEDPNPYRVSALPGKRRDRAAAVAELVRVAAGSGSVTLDFPNGWFPIDFWHGDHVGSFRLHRLPDALNPSLREIAGYFAGARFRLLRVADRLRFRQISTRWWGRLLSPPMRAFLIALDHLPQRIRRPLAAVFSPFLVVRIERGAKEEDHA